MGIAAFMKTVVDRRRLLPSSEDVATRLRQLEEVLAEVTAIPEIAGGSVHLEINGFRSSVDDIKKRLPLKPDGSLDDTVWSNEITWPSIKKRSIYWDLTRIWKGARGINAGELVVGRWYFAIFFALFVIVSVAYLCWYRQAAPIPTDIIDLDRILNTTQTRLRELRSTDAAEKEVATAALAALKPQMRTALLKISSDYDSLRLLSALESDIDTGQITSAQSFERFRDHTRKTLARLTVASWPYIHRDWLEIAWWAELGTLVGILFYLCGLLSNGLFRVEEVATFWTEIAIAPIVIPVVFFLFAFVSLSDPSKASSTVRLGIAFLLGFSIRRTVGLLDLAKKKILPDPNTSPSNVKAIPSPGQKVPTVTTVISSTQRPTVAAPAVLTVTVRSTTANAGVPTGTITLNDGATVVESDLSLTTDGTVSHAPSLGVGLHAITATYSGDTAFSASKGELRQEVFA